jgi:Asp-tRNA(Asn)/Glu-tRNA(Gln) amidotransferase A subunit family amidase
MAIGPPGGCLEGVRFAVKDVIDVAGTVTGAGHPDWAAAAEPAGDHALAVTALLAAGGELCGTTHTDELAWSLSGTNAHHGAPANPKAPGRAPGGSSSGSASAVAAGEVDLALGTDTGGSIRVPASYCGIVGLRPTHARVAVDGVFPLAPSFDTVGLLAGSVDVLGRAWRALSAVVEPMTGRDAPVRLVLAADVAAWCDPGVAEAVGVAASHRAAQLGVPLVEVSITSDGDLGPWIDAFAVLQGAEAWAAHGGWISTANPSFGPGVTARVDAARARTPDEVVAAGAVRRAATGRVLDVLGTGDVLVLPAAPGSAHPLDRTGLDAARLRRSTLACTVAASLTGTPSLCLPWTRAPDGLPVGVCLLGAPGDDELLIALAVEAG